MKPPGPRQVEAFVLAGGRSTRMGQDKALLEWRGMPLAQHAIEKLRGLGMRVRIAGSRPDLSRFAEAVPDLHPGCGPLGGIEAALASSECDRNLFLAVDSPWLPAVFLAWMLERVGHTAALATIPRLAGRPQPLCAVYHQALLPGLTASIERGDYKVMRALDAAIELACRDGQHCGPGLDSFDVEEIYSSHFDWPVDPPVRRWFENWNTPADLVPQ